MNGPGFLGTQASFIKDITLVLEILFYLMLCAGVAAQLRGLYKWHDRFQIPVVLLNILLIAFVMLPSFSGIAGSIPAKLNQVPVAVTLIHGILGTIAQGLAIYCLLAGLKYLPRKIGVLRYWMWATFIAWTATVFFGVSTYVIYYAMPSNASPTVGEHDATQVETATSPSDTPITEIVAEHNAEIAPTKAAPTIEVVSEHDAAVVDNTTPRNFSLISGWYQGRSTFYYDFGSNLPISKNKTVIPAPIYALITGFDADGKPQLVAGQHNIVGVIPGNRGYSDLWQVNFVTVPENYVANSFTSVGQILTSGYPITATETYVNCPIVPANSSVSEIGSELVQGWYNGQAIFYFDFGPNPVQIALIYALISGFDGDGKPKFIEGQHNILDVIPGDEGYSAFWEVNLVTVPADYKANTITSVAQILTGNYEIKQAGIFVNCPIVSTSSK